MDPVCVEGGGGAKGRIPDMLKLRGPTALHSYFSLQTVCSLQLGRPVGSELPHMYALQLGRPVGSELPHMYRLPTTYHGSFPCVSQPSSTKTRMACACALPLPTALPMHPCTKRGSGVQGLGERPRLNRWYSKEKYPFQLEGRHDSPVIFSPAALCPGLASQPTMEGSYRSTQQ